MPTSMRKKSPTFSLKRRCLRHYLSVSRPGVQRGELQNNGISNFEILRESEVANADARVAHMRFD